MVTCWERADLLALLYVMLYCVLSLSHVVSWVKCGAWLYGFLIFAFLFWHHLLLLTSDGLSPPVKYFTDRSKAVLLLWIFYVFVLSCVCYVLCASVYMCFVVTCWERADLLALVCGVFCEFVTFPLVSWVRCGTWLYRFLIFAPLLTFVKTWRGKPFRSCIYIFFCKITLRRS